MHREQLDTAVQRRSTFKNCARRQNGGDPFVGSNFPWKGGKATLFEGGVRTPSFVYSELLPPSVRGTNVTHPTHIADFYATFCNLAGIDPQDTRPGACRKPAPPAHPLARGMRARARGERRIDRRRLVTSLPLGAVVGLTVLVP